MGSNRSNWASFMRGIMSLTDLLGATQDVRHVEPAQNQGWCPFFMKSLLALPGVN